MLALGHVTALLPLLINDASGRAEVGPQGQMLLTATDTATDGAPGCLVFITLDVEAESHPIPSDSQLANKGNTATVAL